MQALNANHRDICKFDSLSDTNYRSIRNRLASMISLIKAGDMSAWSPLTAGGNNMHKKKMQQIHEYLKVSDSAEDILASMEERRLEGSCRWLTQREQFREWQFSEKRGELSFTP